MTAYRNCCQGGTVAPLTFGGNAMSVVQTTGLGSPLTFDEAVDGGLEIDDGAEDTAFEPPPGAG